MKTITILKKQFIIPLLFLVMGNVWGQVTYTGSPTSAAGATCPPGINESCGSTTYYGNIIKAYVYSINGNSITIRVVKCNNPTTFGSGGTLKVMFNTICGTQVVSTAISSGGTFKDITFNATQTGTNNFRVLLISTSNFYTNEFSLTGAVQQPDLYSINESIAPPYALPGESVNFTNQVRNQGNSSALSSNTGYYLSTTANLSAGGGIYLGQSYVPALNVNQTSSLISSSIIIPNSTLPGNYYLCFRADDSDSVIESDENNNSQCMPFTVLAYTLPSLKAESCFQFSSPTSLSIGANLIGLISVRNSPSSLTWSGIVTILIRKKIGQIDAQVLTSETITLAGGSSQTIYFDTPLNVINGVYAIYCIYSNSPNGSEDFLENNGCGTCAGLGCVSTTTPSALISVSSLPNLTCNNATITPNNPVQGQAYTFSYPITNSGSANYTGALTLWWRNSTSGFPLATYSNGISAGNSYTFNYNNASLNSPPGTWYLRVEDSTGNIVGNCSTTVNVVAAPASCTTWAPPPSSPATGEALTATNYLCDAGIIDSNQNGTNNYNDGILRKDIAKIVYLGLYKNLGTPISPSFNYPIPFHDMQNLNASNTYWYNAAKVLCHLEYGDGISPFDKNFYYFNPEIRIERRYVIKLLLEAFNIAPSTSTANPYSDVPSFDPMFGYIKKAHEMGLMTGNTVNCPTGICFKPYDNMTRQDAFVLLYRILNSSTISRPTLAQLTDVNNYYVPTNITTRNFARQMEMNDGNFNSYTKTSFGINGLMPLSFTHTYNSAYTDLPNFYYGIEPMGKGWSHNYNCYIQEVSSTDATNSVIILPKTMVYWGDGTMNSFVNNSGTYVSETEGLYATLTKTNGGNTYTYKTKNQMTYVFTKIGTVWTLTQIRDRNNNQNNLSWTLNGTVPRLNSVSDPANRQIQFTYYSGTNTIWKVIETCLNREIVFTYINNNETLYTYKDTRNNITTYGYENYNDPRTRHLLKQITLPMGNVVNNTYNKRKLASSNLAGSFQTTVNAIQNYNGGNSNNVNSASVSVTQNGQTLTTNSQLNTLGNVTYSQSPTSTMTVGYTDTNQPTKPTTLSNSVNNLSSAMQYDTNGNVTQITKTGAGTTITESFQYNSLNDLTQHTNGRGFVSKFDYDANGNLTKTTDALNNITVIIPNGNGTVNKVTNPAGIYTEYEYNNFGNPTKSKLMGMLVNENVYDAASRINKTIDPNGVETRIEYEPNDLVKKITIDPTGLNNIVSTTYDNNDNKIGIVNPMGVNTTLTYNDKDQLVQYGFAGQTKNYSYNNDGSLNVFTDQNTVNFTNAYNTDGTLQGDGYATYTYNADKSVNTITRSGRTIAFEYDNLKRTTRVKYNDFSSNNTAGVQYTYDANNNITSITYPTGFKVGYGFDALDRLTRVYNFATNTDYCTYSYLTDGRISQQTNANGTKTIYSYDSFGRVNKISNQKSDNSIIFEQSYGMDSLGNHTSETTTEPNAPSSIATYNWVTVPYTHPTGNRMQSQGTDTFTYDGNGNSKTSTGSGIPVYTYDAKDNLLTNSQTGDTCEYDALENRRLKSNTRFALDILGGNNVLMETDLSGNPTALYVHGLGLVCRLDAAQTNPSFYHYDYRGSTVNITNSTQTVTHKYKYGPFGELLGSADVGFTNRFRYVGKYGVQFDAANLYYMRARYYNPYQGRFLGEDPVWSTNLYTYCENDPINKVDADGRKSRYPDYDKKIDWCGSKGTKRIPDKIEYPIFLKNNFAVKDLKKDCYHHDNCYDSYGVTKGYCDSKLPVYGFIMKNTGIGNEAFTNAQAKINSCFENQYGAGAGYKQKPKKSIVTFEKQMLVMFLILK